MLHRPPHPTLLCCHGCVFNKSLTGYSTVWGQPLLGTPRRSADRVRVSGSIVQKVRSDDSVLLLVEGRSCMKVGNRSARARGRCEGHKGKNESLEMVSCWADPEPSSCQPEVFALPLTSPLFIFKPAAAAPPRLKWLVSAFDEDFS